MTGSRTRSATTPGAPRAVTGLTPDPHHCTTAYQLGRTVGQLIAAIAGTSPTHRKLVGAAGL